MAPLNRHELRARCGAMRIASLSIVSTPIPCESRRIKFFSSSRISAIVPKRSRGFLASARLRII